MLTAATPFISRPGRRHDSRRRRTLLSRLGDGAGWLVFVASFSLPGDMWAYQMLPLVRAGFRCIAFDRRGHGRSSDPGRGYDYDTLADDIAAVMETRSTLKMRRSSAIRWAAPKPFAISRVTGRRGSRGSR